MEWNRIEYERKKEAAQNQQIGISSVLNSPTDKHTDQVNR